MLTNSRMEQICLLVTDGTHDSPKLLTEGIPFIKGKHISGGFIDYSNCDYISQEDHLKAIKRVLPKPGDVLFSNIGSVGDTARVIRKEEFSIKNVALFRPNPEKIDPRYFYFLISNPVFKTAMLNLKSGSAQPFITLGSLRSFSTSYHEDKSVQRRIASILSAYDDLIENNTRRIAILEEMARRIYEEWFVHFRFPGHEQVKMVESELGLIPEGWRKGSINELYVGLYDGPHATPKPTTSGPVFLGIGNLTETGRMDLSSVRHIAEEDFGKWTKRVCPQAGDIVFTYEATLNRYALIPNGFRGCLGRRIALIRTNPEAHSNLYLFCMFFSDGWRQVVAQNTLSGATVDRIPLSKFPSFPIMIPSMSIMAAFDGIVRPMFAEIEILGRKNVNLRTTRDLLLPKLISGELDVSNLPTPEEVSAA